MRNCLAPLLALLVGCGGHSIDDDLIKSDESLRALVEKPAPLVEPSTEYRRFGYDEHGHLKPGKELVNGYEVPMGAKFVKRYPSFLELQIRADFEDVRDFYSGVDGKRKRRFADRRYLIKDGKRAFTVHHTDDSLALLKLPAKYKKANVFVRPGQLRNQNIRVHMVPEVAEEPYIPPAPARGAPQVAKQDVPAPSPAPARRSGDPSVAPHGTAGGSGGGSNGSRSDGKSGSGGSGGGNGGGSGGANAGGSAGGNAGGSGGGSGGSAGPEGPTPMPFGQKLSEGTNSAGQPKRWGPYPPEQKVDPSQRIEAWKKANPGKKFLD